MCPGRNTQEMCGCVRNGRKRDWFFTGGTVREHISGLRTEVEMVPSGIISGTVRSLSPNGKEDGSIRNYLLNHEGTHQCPPNGEENSSVRNYLLNREGFIPERKRR
jgi:hypothetical protein